MRAVDHYNKLVYGGEVTEPTSLYSSVKTPFTKLPPIVEKALNNAETPSDIALRPRVDLLSQLKAITSQDNTRVIPQQFTPDIKLINNDITQPKLPTGAALQKLSGGFDANKFTKDTYTQESGGNYKAWSDTSTATGKYQFLWGTKAGKMWGDDIRRVTGVTSREQFRDSPKAQEQFYNFYLEKHIKPAVKKLASQGAKFGLTPTEVGRVVHFQGKKGAEIAFAKGKEALYTRDGKGNPSIMEYLGKIKDKKG
jgi:hypothetical protein